MAALHLLDIRDLEARYTHEFDIAEDGPVNVRTKHKLAICQRDYSTEYMNTALSPTFVLHFLGGRRCCKFCLRRIAKDPDLIYRTLPEGVEIDEESFGMFMLGIIDL